MRKHPSGLKALCTLALLYALTIGSVAFATGCPEKDKLRSAVEASYRLPGATNDIIAKVAEGRDAGIISQDQARKFGEALNKMAMAEVVFVKTVKTIHAAAKLNGGKANAGELLSARDFFDESIVGPFLEILEFTRVLSGDNVKLILLAVTAARLLIRTIGIGIGSNKINALAAAAKFLTSNPSEFGPARVRYA